MLDKNLKKATTPDDAGEAAVAAETGMPADEKLASTLVDLVKMGLNDVAYIRRATINDTPMWSIHSAAGHPLGAAETFDQAWAAVKQHNLEPLRVN
jgi:hypothetical protein